MRYLILRICPVLILFFISCKNDSFSDNIFFVKKDTTNDFETCNRLFVFIGEKIEVKPLPVLPFEGGMDGHYLARYIVLQTIYGGILTDTIEFEAYDHYGLPPFAEFKNAMLFVRKDSSGYLHLKYQYFGLYKTVDGRWASPYSIHNYYKNCTILPVKISFKDKLFYDDDRRNWYLQPRINKRSEPAGETYGNYIPELFLLEKQGVLQGRGFF